MQEAEESSFRRHLVILTWQLFIALSLVYVPSGDNLMDAPPRGGLSASTQRAVPSCLDEARKGSPRYIALLAWV